MTIFPRDIRNEVVNLFHRLVVLELAIEETLVDNDRWYSKEFFPLSITCHGDKNSRIREKRLKSLVRTHGGIGRHQRRKVIEGVTKIQDPREEENGNHVRRRMIVSEHGAPAGSTYMREDIAQ